MNIHTNHNHKYVEHIARGMQESVDPDSVQITIEPVDSSKWIVHVGTLLRVAIPIEPLKDKEDACYKAGVEVGKEFKEYILKWAKSEDCQKEIDTLKSINKELSLSLYRADDSIDCSNLKQALREALDIIDREVGLRTGHSACDLNSPCDYDCMRRAKIVKATNQMKKLLEEVK